MACLSIPFVFSELVEQYFERNFGAGAEEGIAPQSSLSGDAGGISRERTQRNAKILITIIGSLK